MPYANSTPQINVERRPGSPAVTKVVWVDGDDQLDMTYMRVVAVEGEAKYGEPPLVKVTFLGRMVDIESPEQTA